MVFAAVFAAGSGSRMGQTALPKQFLPLGGKPVLIHTLEAFLPVGEIDGLFVLCPPEWIDYTREQIAAYLPDAQIGVAAGGATRNDTLLCAIRYVRERYPVDEDTILLTHDAVRPFVTEKIIIENISAVREDGACDTVIPATDTIVHSTDGAFISDVPLRSELYQGQTPQSFRLPELQRAVESLTAEEAETLTDACKIYAIRGKKVRLVAGSVSNMKITYADDLPLAEAILRGRQS
ncbi:MAG: 2-C-methyl-D-erythritol 4-phosphate cytidylyltransferase [Clostridia bacterium]|nr:2-C-methyl-D-erythritol 4-phosphate cytidylyltransferase [Clostridia bacterium]